MHTFHLRVLITGRNKGKNNFEKLCIGKELYKRNRDNVNNNTNTILSAAIYKVINNKVIDITQWLASALRCFLKMLQLCTVLNFAYLILTQQIIYRTKKYESQNENNVSVSGSIKSDHAVTSLQDWIRLNQEQPKISKVG